jgi:predicted RNA-binding Zn ribbon-like protein
MVTVVIVAQPADRAPAPAPLDQVQSFLNTVDHLDGTRDRLVDGDAVAEWLAAAGHLAGPSELSSRDTDRVLALREALRTVCHHHRDPAVDPATALRVMNDSAVRARLMVDFCDHGRLIARAPGIDGALGSLLSVVHRSMGDGTWERLKACDGCGWVFYDGSRSGIGRWCSMSICGNRAKARAHRARQGARPAS